MNTKHYIDHYEVDESTYGIYQQDGSTNGHCKKIGEIEDKKEHKPTHEEEGDEK